MKVLQIIKYPAPILNQKIHQLIQFPPPPHIYQSLKNIKFTFQKYYPYGAVGLSAPQLNLPLRAFCMKKTITNRQKKQLLILNPQIVKYSDQMQQSKEYCLSFGMEKPYFVNRHASIKVQYQNQQGLTIEQTLMKKNSIIFQHEFDHLQGITIEDRVKREVQS